MSRAATCASPSRATGRARRSTSSRPPTRALASRPMRCRWSPTSTPGSTATRSSTASSTRSRSAASTRPGSRKGAPRMPRPSQQTLEQRLAEGIVLGAEGYVFELERRGYVKAGPFVPEVILDEPEALRQLHREFLRAGADVMVALTYYAHREKLEDVGRG